MILNKYMPTSQPAIFNQTSFNLTHLTGLNNQQFPKLKFKRNRKKHISPTIQFIQTKQKANIGTVRGI